VSYRRAAVLWGPPVLYAAGIFYLSSQTDPLPQVTSVVWDKALHAGEYAGLALLICRAFRGDGTGWARAFAASVVLTCMYAATDEWHQWMVPGREVDWHDWIADGVGAVLGSALYLLTEGPS
jgi:VanZ family protein